MVEINEGGMEVIKIIENSSSLFNLLIVLPLNFTSLFPNPTILKEVLNYFVWSFIMINLL
jgi:hypothetical protein